MPLKPDLGGLQLPSVAPKGYPGQVKRHSLPSQVEASLKYLVEPLTFAHDCTYSCMSHEQKLDNEEAVIVAHCGAFRVVCVFRFTFTPCEADLTLKCFFLPH